MDAAIGLQAAPLIGGSVVQPNEDPARRLWVAGQLAPVIWLAKDEIAYPMPPHPFAFDGVDNDEDGCTDLEDEDEVTAVVSERRLSTPEANKEENARRRDDVRVVLENLREARLLLRRLSSSQVSEEEKARDRTRLLKEFVAKAGDRQQCASGDHRRVRRFKVCRVGPADESITCGPRPTVLFESTLGGEKKEGQTVSSLLGLGATQVPRKDLLVVQYWMYYPWDEAHLHDGEHTTVIAEEGTLSVVAQIGAGHVPQTANNILVARAVTQRLYSSAQSFPRERPFPYEVPRHLPVLVEMGKHASAPDFNCNGVFDIGNDANIFPTGVWGTRDVAFGLKKTVWGEFKDWYSLSRDEAGLLVEESVAMKPSAGRYPGSCPEESLGQRLLEREELPSFKLVPASLYEQLDGFIEKASSTRDGQERLKAFLFENRAYLSPFAAWERESDVGFDISALNAWIGDRKASTAPRPDIWHHVDYGKYENDFKLSILPRISGGILFSGENGNGKAGVFARFANFWKLPDSSVEIQALWENLHLGKGLGTARENAAILNEKDPGHPVELVALYNMFSTTFRGPYVGLSYRPGYRNPQQITLYQGGKPVPAQDVVAIEAVGWNLYGEVGYAFRYSRVQFRIGAAGPFVRQHAARDDRPLKSYDSAPSMELRFSAQIGIKLLRAKHPLAP